MVIVKTFRFRVSEKDMDEVRDFLSFISRYLDKERVICFTRHPFTNRRVFIHIEVK